LAKVGITYNDKQLRNNVRTFDSRLKHNVGAVVDRRAGITTTELKTSARWTDRTGAARSGLMALPIHGATFEEIFMAYSVNYGIWLEVAHDRKYECITPMMRIAGAALMEDLRHLIDRMEKMV
jgi:hypothetical protein